MQFTQDNRAVSEVIGAILVFGLMISLLAVLQTALVPAANEEVEFNHHDAVESQLVDFHGAAAETARVGDADSTKLKMGVQYPSRMLFFNPPSPAGTLSTSDEATVRIENVQAEDDTVAKYMDSGPIEVGTRSLQYQANYNEYGNAPVTRYEYGVLYNDHQQNQLLVNDGGVIQGRDISLLMPAGELHESSSRAISLDPRPVSAPARPVSITGDGTGNITLTLPSEMNASLWEDAVDTSHVQSIEENGDGTVTIELDPSETYSLRMARVGVGSNTPSQTPTYVFSPSGTQLDIPQGQSRVIDVEIRDELNNPVANEELTLEVDDGTIQGSVETDEDGVARPRFDAPSDPTRTTIRATLDDNFTNYDPDTDPRDLEIDVWVTKYAGGYGSPPEITKLQVTSQCGAGDGNLLDDPVDTISSEDSVVEVDWEASHTDTETSMDTVDVRIIRQSDNRVGDSATYSYDESVTDGSTQTVGDDTGLVDKGGCGSEYVARVFAETTGSSTDMKSSDPFTTS